MSRDDRLDRALETVGSPLRGLRGVRACLSGLAAALLVLAATAWWARVTQAELVVLVFWAWGLALVALGAGFWRGRRLMRQMGPWWVASLLEESEAWRRGSVTTMLDPAAPGTSAALRAQAELDATRLVVARGPDTLAPVVEHARRRGRHAVAAVVGAAVLLLAARPLEGAPASLWRPWAALVALTTPVELKARSPSVGRGEPGVFELMAAGHRQAVLYTRAPGEAWHATVVALDADGRAEFTTQALSAEIIGRLEAGGRASGEVRIGIRLPAFMGSTTLTAHYPAYLGLPAEALPLAGEALILPEGTRLDLAGQATVALQSVVFASTALEVPLTVVGMRFSGSFLPTGSAEWVLRANPADGSRLDGEMPHLLISVVPDSAPIITIPVPAADTTAGPTLRLDLLVAAQDDHGVQSAHLELRRGRLGTATRIALDLGGGVPARALLPAALDLVDLGLLAGDTLFYSAVASDNSPARHLGRSDEYWVRFPSEAELRAAQASATVATGQGLDSLVQRAAAAQRQSEDLARERSRSEQSSAASGTPNEPLSAEAARKAEAVVQTQETLLKDAVRINSELEKLRSAAEKQGLADPQFLKQLDDIRQLLRQADTPELREALAALQEALKRLDPDAVRTAVKDVAQRQAEFKNAMEQARELFKRAALEGDLSSLQQQTKELGQAQQALTPKLTEAASKLADPSRAGADTLSAGVVAKQNELAARADSLAAALDKAAGKVPSDSVKNGLQRVAEQVRAAGDQMQQAASAAKSGESQQAEARAKSAQQKMAQAEEAVKEQKENLQEAMKEEVLLALDRTLKETSRLAQRQVALADRFRMGSLLGGNRTEQVLIDDGLGRLIAQMSAISSLNAMVPQQIGVALAAARVKIRNVVEALSSVSPDPLTAASESGEAIDALMVAAFAMLRAKDRVSGSASGSGMQEAMQEMQKAAEEQRKAAGQTGQQVQSGSESSLQQLMQMAMQQRAIAGQLDRLQASGQIASAGMMAKEAKDLAREIESGQLTRETTNRQEKLYRRMLDAGRQLQGEEQDDENQRKATTARDGSIRPPPPLDPRLRQGALGIQFPGWETLQRFSPDERRRVLDYFQRLTEVKRP